MNALPKAIQEAIESLSNLPGIGTRSAERLILSLIQNKTNLDQKIASSIGNLKKNIHECKTCFHYCEGVLCPVCANENREAKQLCVLESPLDLVAMERCHEYKGYYHVLHGVISPLNKVGPDAIRIHPLIQKIKENKDIQEIIFATSSTTEGEATALYIIEEIKPFFQGRITRLARGIPSGGDLDYLDIGTIGRALLDRREF